MPKASEHDNLDTKGDGDGPSHHGPRWPRNRFISLLGDFFVQLPLLFLKNPDPVVAVSVPSLVVKRLTIDDFSVGAGGSFNEVPLEI